MPLSTPSLNTRERQPSRRGPLAGSDWTLVAFGCSVAGLDNAITGPLRVGRSGQTVRVAARVWLCQGFSEEANAFTNACLIAFTGRQENALSGGPDAMTSGLAYQV